MVSVVVVISRGGEVEVCMTRLSMRTKRSLHSAFSSPSFAPFCERIPERVPNVRASESFSEACPDCSCSNACSVESELTPDKLHAEAMLAQRQPTAPRVADLNDTGKVEACFKAFMALWVATCRETCEIMAGKCPYRRCTSGNFRL